MKVEDMRCDVCGSVSIIAIAPGEAPEAADLLTWTLPLRAGTPPKAYCEGCWRRSWSRAA